MKKRYCGRLFIALSVLLLSACGNLERASLSQSVPDMNHIDDNAENELEELSENISKGSNLSEGSNISIGSNISKGNNIPEGDVGDEAGSSKEEKGEGQMKELIIGVGGQRFRASLYDNETTQALMERLPMTLNMEELNGNEKYYYLEEELPANSERIDRIRTGDIMLFGSDCLVLFFDDFDNSYSYTRIGHIEDREAFADALEDGTVEVSFETGE